MLATPTTLIALLRTVAHGWSHEALADQAREIHRLGRDLHGRLASLSSHVDQVGRSLNAAVGHYNQAVGSLESRVLVVRPALQRPLGHRRRAALAAAGRVDDPLPGLPRLLVPPEGADRWPRIDGRSIGAPPPTRGTASTTVAL